MFGVPTVTLICTHDFTTLYIKAALFWRDGDHDPDDDLSGLPQMGPIRAEFWLKAAPLASWSRRHCRKTGRASGVGSISRSKMAIFLSFGRTSPISNA